MSVMEILPPGLYGIRNSDIVLREWYHLVGEETRDTLG